MSALQVGQELQYASIGEGAAAVLVTGVIFLAALKIGQRMLSQAVRAGGVPQIRWVDDPIPGDWNKLLPELFPASAFLPPHAYDRLLRLVQVFLRDTSFEGGGGFEITDSVRLSVASQACYLVLGKQGEPFPDTHRVIVYPETFMPRRPVHGADFELVEADIEPTLGESWGHGTVILSWPSVVAGSRDPEDGWNVVFHEFAHQLDQSDGDAGGIPADLGGEYRARWQEVLSDRLQALRQDIDEGRQTYLDDYAATNEAEFFAVATEAFFELPAYLHEADRELYELLGAYYVRDPANE